MPADTARLLAIVCFLGLHLYTLGAMEEEEDEEEIVVNMTAIAGKRVSMSCDISPRRPDDQPSLVLWYKDDWTTPIYSVDGRRGALAEARHAATDHLAGRAYFNLVPNPALLSVDYLRLEDEGEYRCRVDFRKDRSRNKVVFLNIIVLPESPIIKDVHGKVLSGLIGPYNEGSPLQLICDVEGGRPSPSVTWWLGSDLLDDSYEVSGGLTRNHLELELARTLLMARLECQASNNQIEHASTASVTLDLNLRPSEVSIETDFNPLLAGREVNISCVTRGSRPSAVLTWWKGGARLADSGGSAGHSTLRFRPLSSDGGQWLVCRAANPALPGRWAEDARRMEVHYPPEISLKLAEELVKEGNSVILECSVRANPPLSRFSWLFENLPIDPARYDVLAFNRTLIIRNVTRAHRGHYTCEGTNIHGHTKSNSVFLRVQYPPRCVTGERRTFGAGLHEAVRVTCEVEADPAEVTFYWAVNTSAGRRRSVDRAEPADGLRSVATYVPRTEKDYGRLLCWAVNVLGGQRRPCEFHIVPADPPDPVHGCEIFNMSDTGFGVRCQQGNDGGLSQEFYAEIFRCQALTDRLDAQELPEFYIDGLEPGSSVLVLVYAANRQGRSRAAVLEVTTQVSPETPSRQFGVSKGGTSEGRVALNPLLVGIIGGILFVSLCLLVGFKIFCYRSQRRRIRKRNADSSEFECSKEEQELTDLRPKDSSACHIASPSQKQNIYEKVPGDSSVILKNQWKRRRRSEENLQENSEGPPQPSEPPMGTSPSSSSNQCLQIVQSEV